MIVPFGGIEAAAQAVEDGIGLFEDFLEHEMIVAAFFDGCQFQVELLDEGCDLFVAQIFEDQFVRFENGQFVVIDIDDFLGVFDDG